jgi:hypothetical protein
MRVAPRPGLKIRHPVTKQHVPAEGFEMPTKGIAVSFFRRRLACGDLVVVVDVKEPIPDSRGR